MFFRPPCTNPLLEYPFHSHLTLTDIATPVTPKRYHKNSYLPEKFLRAEEDPRLQTSAKKQFFKILFVSAQNRLKKFTMFQDHNLEITFQFRVCLQNLFSLPIVTAFQISPKVSAESIFSTKIFFTTYYAHQFQLLPVNIIILKKVVVENYQFKFGFLLPPFQKAVVLL